MHSDEWRELPLEQQMAWIVPIEIMLNVTHLRESQPVVTTTEYLLLHNLTSEDEATNGYWRRDEYHRAENVFSGTRPTFFAIENGWYDPEGTVRVDTIPPEMRARKLNMSRDIDRAANASLYNSLSEGKSLLGWDEIEGALNTTHEGEIESLLIDAGWEVLHTYDSV